YPFFHPLPYRSAQHGLQVGAALKNPLNSLVAIAEFCSHDRKGPGIEGPPFDKVQAVEQTHDREGVAPFLAFTLCVLARESFALWRHKPKGLIRIGTIP